MKKIIVLIFLLLTTIMFSEEKSIDEGRELREKVIRLEAVIERIEKEQESSISYYREALVDSKEIYNGAVENNNKILNHIYWAISGVFTILAAFLALIKLDNNKRLEKEKIEIKKENRRSKTMLKTENKKLIERVEGLEEKLQNSFKEALNNNTKEIKEENKKLDEKLEKVDEDLKQIKIETEESRENYMKTKINSGISQALAKGTDEEKYDELKKLKEEVKTCSDKYKENLYFQIAYYVRGNEEKIEYYTKVLKLNTNNIHAYFNRGVVYLDKGNLEKALENYDKALELNPTDVEVYNNRAEAYIAKKQLEDALKDLVKCLEIDSNYKFAIDVTQENYDKFIKFMEEKEDKTELESEILRRFKKENGVQITE